MGTELHFKRVIPYWCLTAVIILLNLLPLAMMYFYGDDMTSADMYSVIAYRSKGMWYYYNNNWVYNTIVVGRFYPLHLVQRQLVFSFLRKIYGFTAFL